MGSSINAISNSNDRAVWILFHWKYLISRYMDSHDKDKTVVRPSYLYNGNSCTGKMVLLY